MIERSAAGKHPRTQFVRKTLIEINIQSVITKTMNILIRYCGM